ncbi:MAG TPA: hypothetical protein VGZ52_10865, partial [Acidimicrobiales bacterium]|nr:hypothetical protein [Acidimicrobiales bacterium]
HPAGAALRSASAALAAAVRDFVRRAAHADAATRDRVERRVIAATREWAAVDRAWYLPLGFDPEPDAVAAVDVVLAAPSSHE